MKTVLINGVECLFGGPDEVNLKPTEDFPFVYSVRSDKAGEPRSIEKHVDYNCFGTILAPQNMVKKNYSIKYGQRSTAIETCTCGCGSPSFLFLN